MPDIIALGVVDSDYTYSALPAVERIVALPSYRGWLQADYERATIINGKFSAFNSIGGGMAFNNVIASPKYPKVIEDALLDPAGGQNYQAAKFYNDDQDTTTKYNRVQASTAAIDWGQDWTLVFIYKVDTTLPTAINNLMAMGSGATKIAAAQSANADTMAFLYNTSGIINMPSTHDTWHVMTLGFKLNAATPASSRMSARIDGARMGDVTISPINSAAIINIGTSGTGTPFSGLLSDVIALQSYTFEDPDTFDALEQFPMAAYGFQL